MRFTAVTDMTLPVVDFVSNVLVVAEVALETEEADLLEDTANSESLLLEFPAGAAGKI